MISFNKLIYALSDALDLVGVDDIYHGKRVAYMALEMAEYLGWEDTLKEELFYASLLHDCGVSSSLIHDKLVFTFDWEGAEDHCVRGYQLLGKSPKLSYLKEYILYHHTHWEDLQRLEVNEKIADVTNLIFLADRVDALNAQYMQESNSHHNETTLLVKERIQNSINEQKSIYFKEEFVEAFLKVSSKEVFWFTLEEDSLKDYLKEFMYASHDKDLSLYDIKGVAELFAVFVDSKSPYTADHSLDVAKLSRFIAKKFDLDEETLEKIEIAGLLHDLGKLRIPDEILEKKSPLNDSEYDTIKIHSFETGKILHHIKGLEDIATWAAEHHETLNGKGYPYKKEQKEISLPSRIIAVADIFQALAQERPYRSVLKPTEILKILEEKSANGDIDSRVVDVVSKNLLECWEISVSHSFSNTQNK